ncbi:hypothetical protein [Novosphingobium sp.]|uniref:hypothetical protein n=1 Tax=Novosphingobium sp. TaxID=1874826 RepID=UPI0025E837BF|nr:hypothetical protein [Novosphingobium sp.]
MTIRLAAVCPAAPLFFSPVQQRRVVQRAANDNAAPGGRDPVLGDALKHFARHGLAAASIARDEAQKAFFANDRGAYLHWLAICRTLDGRMADALAARSGKHAG